MARKKGVNPFTRLSKEKQIASLKKQLANPKTPRQFLPSIRERLAKLEGK